MSTEKNIDRLIDSAFAKDKAGLPQQDDMPPASLLAQVRATAPVAQAGAGLFSSLTAKIISALVIMGGAAVLVFLLTKPDDVTVSPLQNPVADSVSQFAPPPIVVQADTAKPRKKRLDSVLSKEQPSLIMPSAPPTTYEKDKATGTINKK